MGEQHRDLREVFQESGLPFFEADGEAAFYGPKIDVQVKDVMGREETLSTIQADQHLPEQFKLEYKDSDDTPKRPVMIHRGVISTMERMISYLIELYAGAFPVWLRRCRWRSCPSRTGTSSSRRSSATSCWRRTTAWTWT